MADYNRTGGSQMTTDLPEDWELNLFIVDLAEQISEKELKKMKYLTLGNGGIGRKTLQEIDSPLDFLDELRKMCYLDRFNLVHIQAMLLHIGRKDLHTKAVKFARSCEIQPLHFFSPPDNQGEDESHLQFHIGGHPDGGRLEETSRQKIEEIRNLVAKLMRIPAEHVRLVGLQPLCSLVLTFCVPTDYVDVLFTLTSLEVSYLQEKKVDFFTDRERSFDVKAAKAAEPIIISENDEIRKIIGDKEKLQVDLDECHAELRKKQRELALLKETHDQNRGYIEALASLATYAYRHIPGKGDGYLCIDNFPKDSVLRNFKYSYDKFLQQYPSARDRLKLLLDANALVARKTERELWKSYAVTLQFQFYYMVYVYVYGGFYVYPMEDSRLRYSEHFDRPESEIASYVTTPTSTLDVPPPLFHRSVSNPEFTSQHVGRQVAEEPKVFAESKKEEERKKKKVKDFLSDVSKHLTEEQKERLKGNAQFSKANVSDLKRRPEKFLLILCETTEERIPEDPYRYISRRLGMLEDPQLNEEVERLWKAKFDTPSKRKDPLGTTFHPTKLRQSKSAEQVPRFDLPSIIEHEADKPRSGETAELVDTVKNLEKRLAELTNIVQNKLATK